MHTPVLLQTVVEGLQVAPGKKYIDATFGEGGHSKAIVAAGGKVLGLDRDAMQIKKFNALTESKSLQEKLTLVHGNFKDIEEIARQENFAPVDGILFDLGLSYEQISKEGLGLSFKSLQEVLDMRLDESAVQSASTILHTYTQDELTTLFMRNAEEVHAADIAKEIVIKRVGMRSFTVGWLVSLIKQTVKEHSNSAVTRVFQALRIEVNSEFENLTLGLTGASHILAPNGRIAVISFHSLEDRMVKMFIKKHGFTQIGKKALFGDPTLSFERSAVLRIFYV